MVNSRRPCGVPVGTRSGRGRGARRLALGLLSVVLLAACSAAPPPDPAPVPSPTAAAESVRPGVTLRSLGLTHGPVDDVTLPASVSVLERIDQENVITLLLAPEDGLPSAEHLAATLPGAGFEVTASVPGSLTFTSPEWDGAFTTSPEVSGLTLRRL
ncbi:hypothetical protein [Auraticoccus monumenti]|uniref:Uncharacterized protein n=1 Tax=Auraticoccus monumenti TaxID=675864 RepID=A0A1G6Y1M5_9ACTN|nr:hypothetical protein [Auraticoccus monumenti]SDD83526.1 hypothetical protein SAMN04489747_1854 [Auraticoccus monumenti]